MQRSVRLVVASAWLSAGACVVPDSDLGASPPQEGEGEGAGEGEGEGAAEGEGEGAAEGEGEGGQEGEGEGGGEGEGEGPAEGEGEGEGGQEGEGEGPDPRPGCEALDAEACEADPSCEWVFDGGFAEPCECPDCDCDPEDPGCDCRCDCAPLVPEPPEGGRCVPGGGGGCFGLDQGDCAAAAACAWKVEQDCGGGGGDCVCPEPEPCPPGEACDPMPCDCGRPAEAPCDEVGVCVPAGGGDCNDIFDLVECMQEPGCWPMFVAEPCDCGPDGDCGCDGEEGFVCMAEAPGDCLAIADADVCDQTPGCRTEWWGDDCGCPEPACDPDDNCGDPIPCDCGGGGFVCVPDEPPGPGGDCWAFFEADLCNGNAGCMWQEDGGDDCECEPCADGEPCGCACRVAPAGCVPKLREGCDLIGAPSPCDKTPGCYVEQGWGCACAGCACPDGDPNCGCEDMPPCDCPDDGEGAICAPDWGWCGRIWDADLCAGIEGCEARFSGNVFVHCDDVGGGVRPGDPQGGGGGGGGNDPDEGVPPPIPG